MKTVFDKNFGINGLMDSESVSSGFDASKGSLLKLDSRNPRVIAVTSGKGGVGKTNVVANLAVSLSELDRKVTILDADFGLANLDVLLGLTPRYHLGHVLIGSKALPEIMVQGPKGIRVLPASSGMQQMTELTTAQRNRLMRCLASLEADTDYFVIDTAAGISRNVMHFLLSSQEIILVSSPEPTAIVDAYAVIKVVLTESPKKQIQVLINCVESADEALDVYLQINSVVQRFLGREVDFLGHVELDSHVVKAVRSQMLVTQKYPDAPSSKCFRDIARRIRKQETGEIAYSGPIWERLLNDWVN